MPKFRGFNVRLYDIETGAYLQEFPKAPHADTTSKIRLVPCVTGRSFGISVRARLPLPGGVGLPNFDVGIDVYIDGKKNPVSSDGFLRLADAAAGIEHFTKIGGGGVQKDGEVVQSTWSFQEVSVADRMSKLVVAAESSDKQEAMDNLCSGLKEMQLRSNVVKSEPGQIVVYIYKYTKTEKGPQNMANWPSAEKFDESKELVAGQTHYVKSESSSLRYKNSETVWHGEDGPELARFIFVYRDLSYIKAQRAQLAQEQGLTSNIAAQNPHQTAQPTSLNNPSTPSFTGTSSGLPPAPAGSATAIGASHGTSLAETSQAAQTPTSHAMTLRSRLQPKYVDPADSDSQTDGVSDDGSEYGIA